MVSNARDDVPDPDRPVNTTSLSRGIDSVTFLRLCSRAPRIVIWSVGSGFRLILYPSYRKRCAGRGDEPPVFAGDRAFGHRGAPAGVDDVAAGAERLPHLRGVDEVELQVKAHRAGDARLQGTHRAAHRGVRQRADHAAVNETGVVGHVLSAGHLHDRGALASLDEAQAHPFPRPRRCRLPTPAFTPRSLQLRRGPWTSRYLPTGWGGDFLIHGPGPPARAYTFKTRARPAAPGR